MTLALHYALRSDVGLLREGNEDSAFAGPRLLAIADGMGGHAAGEVASAVAISAIAPLDRRGLTDEDEMLGALAAAVLSARSTLHDMSMADPATEGMWTTLTAMLWAGDQVAICHIGDSRAYLLRDKNLYQITRDHTLIQSLVDEGRLSPAAAATHPQRSLIMRALQGSTDADPDLAMHQAFLGDRYLLCSDGLTDVVTDEVVAETLLKYRDADEAVGVLIDQAINNGGPDNITCIVADVVDTVTGPVPPSREQQVAGAAANPDARSMLRDKSAPAASKAATTGPQASVNGHRVRTTVDDDELTGMMPRRRRRWPIVTSVLAVLAVLVIGILALGERSGIAPWARHWPLLFVALAVFLLFRSDPEVWPLGDIGFFASFRDPEVAQHRVFVALIAGFGFFEWCVRTGRIRAPHAALVFPLITAVAGALLLTHQHALSNIKEQLLIEVTHAPLAVFGVTAGWARWLELRLDPPGNRVAGWIWPIAFVLVGVILLIYHET